MTSKPASPRAAGRVLSAGAACQSYGLLYFRWLGTCSACYRDRYLLDLLTRGGDLVAGINVFGRFSEGEILNRGAV
jgi:hypothetical protein